MERHAEPSTPFAGASDYLTDESVAAATQFLRLLPPTEWQNDLEMDSPDEIIDWVCTLRARADSEPRVAKAVEFLKQCMNEQPVPALMVTIICMGRVWLSRPRTTGETWKAKLNFTEEAAAIEL